jgi:hypothetical protein
MAPPENHCGDFRYHSGAVRQAAGRDQFGSPDLGHAKMNQVAEYIKENGLDPKQAMNYLQDLRAVSDNCVVPEDIAEKDYDCALFYLEQWVADGHAPIS